MVQLKLNKKASKPTTPGVSPVSRKRKNGKNAATFLADNCMHLIAMALWCWRLVEVIKKDGPGVTATRKLLDSIGMDSEPSLTAFIWLAVVTLQLDAVCHVCVFWDLYAKTSRIKFRRADLLFKYIQFCIPQVVLGVLVLLEPHGFDLVLQIQITLILNTCFSLVVAVQSYTRLLTRKQNLGKQKLGKQKLGKQKLGKQRKGKQRSTPKESSDEIPTIIVT